MICLTIAAFAQQTQPGVKQANKSTKPNSTTSKSSTTLVGKIFSIRMNNAPSPTNTVIEGISLEEGVCIYTMSISAMTTAPAELVMETAENREYTINLTRYPNPSLSIVGGATLKVTGTLAGNTLYATAIETIKNSEKKICIPSNAQF